MYDILLDSVLDTVRVIPFLFVTYLFMEWVEHRAGKKMEHWIKESRQYGPVAGGLLGVIPQCGFSAAASSLYAGGVISVGTLLAVFLSTSDEMLPILIGEQAPGDLILKILAVKAVAAIIAGCAIDWANRRFRSKHNEEEHIHDLCEHSHCHCHEYKGAGGILMSALIHTLQVALFLFAASILLNMAVEWIGEERLGSMILNRPVIGELLAGIMGLIPNCASSVIITKLYLAGAMGTGAMLSGLLVGSGIGVLVLFRSNRDMKKNLMILGTLYVTGVVLGSLAGLLPIF